MAWILRLSTRGLFSSLEQLRMEENRLASPSHRKNCSFFNYRHCHFGNAVGGLGSMYSVKGIGKRSIIAMVFIVASSIVAHAEGVTEKNGDGMHQQQIVAMLSACLPTSEPIHGSFKRRSLAKLRAPKERDLLAQRRAKCRYQKATKEAGERERADRRRKHLNLNYRTALDLQPK